MRRLAITPFLRGNGARTAFAAALIAWGLALAPTANGVCGRIGTAAEALAATVASGQGTKFVGVVEWVTNRDRWAMVHVEDVWSPGALGEWVEVRGTTVVGPDMIGSDDRTYRPGQRYLFTISGWNGHLFDSDCSSTTPWQASLAALRPATAHPTVPGPTPSRPAPSVLVSLLIGLGGAVVGAGVLVVLRRKRSGGP